MTFEILKNRRKNFFLCKLKQQQNFLAVVKSEIMENTQKQIKHYDNGNKAFTKWIRAEMVQYSDGPAGDLDVAAAKTNPEAFK